MRSMRRALLALGMLLLGSCAAQPAEVKKMTSGASTAQAAPAEGDWFLFAADFMDRTRRRVLRFRTSRSGACSTCADSPPAHAGDDGLPPEREPWAPLLLPPAVPS